jgi:hypothetical protein
MKRLLEWKQRMLQSPLTRKAHSPKPESPKPGQSGSHATSDKLRRQALQELAYQNNASSANAYPNSNSELPLPNGHVVTNSGPPPPAPSSGHRQQRPTSLEVTPLALGPNGDAGHEPSHRKAHNRVKQGQQGHESVDPQQRWSTGSKSYTHRNQAYASFSSDDDGEYHICSRNARVFFLIHGLWTRSSKESTSNF